MKKLLALTTTLLILAAFAAEAQQRTRLRSTRPAAPVAIKGKKILQNAIPVFKVTPGEPRHQYRETDLQFVNRNAAPAPAIPASEKVDILKSGGTQSPSGPGGIQSKPDPKLTHLKMSVKDPYKGKLGYLEFNEVRHLNADKDYVRWYSPNQGMGYMKAHLNLEAGSKYLIDWNVGCDDKRDFHYSSTGGNQTTSLQEGSHHLLAILEPQSSGWTSLMMWADTEWTFYGVEISKTE